MMTYLIAFSLFIIALVPVFIISVCRKRIKKIYSAKTKSELIEARVFARKLMFLCLCLAFLGPVPLSFIIAITNGNIHFVLIGVMILLIISSIIYAYYWWTVDGLIRSLLEDSSSVSDNNSVRK